MLFWPRSDYLHNAVDLEACANSTMSFLRDTKLFLWKNGLQKARNAGITSCECLTPIVLVGLFALLYKATNETYTPDTTYECDFRSNTGGE